MRQEEADVLLDLHHATGSYALEALDTSAWHQELVDTLAYLEEARKHIVRLRAEVLDDKLSSTGQASSSNTGEDVQAITPLTQADEIAIQTRC